MKKIILILVCIVQQIVCDEIYQNSSHICNRCKCNEIKNDFILDCTNQNFQHVLANWPSGNKSLIATFSYNNMTTLEKLPITDKPAKLVFDHCNIQYLDSGVFSNMKNVEFIDLSYNLLTSEQISGDDFKGPYDNKKYRSLAVRHLNLAYNRIHSLPQNFFDNMPDLEELNLEGNAFSVLDPPTQTALADLKKIKVLNLANNKLTELEAYFIRNLHSMTDLDLSSNHLDYVPETLVYISTNLKVLKLNNNFIYRLTDQSFYGLNLEELHLNNLNRLDLIEANTFATQKNLKKLYISGNQALQFIDRDAFGDNQTIDELDLSNNSLSEINFKLNWARLKILKINSNPLVCSCSLYNITKSLSKFIKRSLDGPMCTDKETRDVSQSVNLKVYNLKAEICARDKPLHISKVLKHFNTVRIILVTLSLILLITSAIVITIVVLRYRKRNAFKNYPFSAQVSYNPIHNQHI